jgi:SsrA-binding protein
MKVLVRNKRALFDYEIIEKYDAGISLMGWEVKSIKSGNVNISGAFIKEKFNELFITGMRVALWKGSPFVNKDSELSDRKLLLRRSEISSLLRRSKQDRLTIVPIEIFVNDKGLIKFKIGLAKGRKKYDKRLKLKERDLKRSVDSDRKYYHL